MNLRSVAAGGVVAALLLAAGGAALAQDAREAGRVLVAQMPPANVTPEMMIRRMDADDDGRIARSEFRGPPQQFSTMDADGDGYASPEEIGAFLQRLRSGGGPGGPGGATANPQAAWYGKLPIILTHTHFNVLVERKRDAEEDWDGAEADALRLMERYGIRAAVIMSPPRAPGRGGQDDHFAGLLRIARKHPDRFVASGGGDTLNPAIGGVRPDEVDDDVRRTFVAKAEDIVAAGAKGFGETTALHFSFFAEHPFEEVRPDHPLFLALADIAAKHDVPLDLHMEAVVGDRPVPAELHRRSDANPARVGENISALERLLAHNRRARIIWVHVGMDNTGDRTVALTRRLLRAHPNLYLSITGFQVALGDNWFFLPGRGLNPDWRALILEFPDRFVIGSDIFFQPKTVWHRFPQPLTQATAIVRRPLLPPAVARKVAFENAQKLFRLSLIRPEDYPLPAGAAAAAGAPLRTLPAPGAPPGTGGPAPSEKEMVGPRGLTARQVISNNDRDGDERISRAEFRGPPLQFNAIDRNRDGFVTRDELEARWRGLMGRQ